MTDREFLKTFSGLLAALVALTVIIFVVAQMVSGSGKAKTKVAQATQAEGEIAARIKPVGDLVAAGAAVVANGVIPAAQAADGKGIYDKACMACHAAGVAGAPKLGDKPAWKDRIVQGNDTLYTHALKGFTGKKGMMPPKGGNMSLSDADVKASVDYMVSQGK